MADVLTPKIGLTKIEVGASEDTWGDKVNDNSQKVDDLYDTGPALKVVNGGTGAIDANGARVNLGLGTMATQNANAIAVTGGSINGLSTIRLVSTGPPVDFQETDGPIGNRNWRVVANGGQFHLLLYDDAWSTFTTAINWQRAANSLTLMNIFGVLQVNGATVWHESNDGSGSGLDADKLDNQDGGFYQNASNLNAGQMPAARLPNGTLRHTLAGGAVTVSTAVASGTPAATGDLWIQYV